MERAGLTRLLKAEPHACERNGFWFLCDPHWTSDDRDAAERLMSAPVTGGNDTGWLCLRTGGSGGGFRFARHDELTLGAAVRGFCAHFSLSRVNTVSVLPPWHVSGWMARVRSASTGGTCIDCDWKDVEAGQRPAIPAGDWVLSLVPTQLQRLMADSAATEWLRRFAVIFLGGGPTWPALAEAAAGVRLPVALSYGMTETAAMVVAQRPAEFLAGDRSAGRVLSHARVKIDADGRVIIDADSLFRGYFPERRPPGAFATQDLGRIDEAGGLHLLGRVDAAIITGGRKVQPAEVEAVLRESGEFDDIVVIGVPHAEWGEEVVACYPASPRSPDVSRASASLAGHQRPKRFVAMADWPRNAQGKINRVALRERIERGA